MSYLRVKNIEKSYGSFKALKNVGFEIEKGEFICFLGPSGCGKTTLLRTIAGLEDIDSGNIYLGDEDITTKHPGKRNMTIVFQSYALFPNMTIKENIAFGMKNKKIPQDIIDKKVDECLELVGLRGSEYKYPSELSGGQQQRVAIARAIAFSPDILLLDEPLSALDAKVREKLRNDIKELQKKIGVTTIMVTHDQEEALSMADKILVMNAGEVVQIGSPEEIYEKPVDDFIADFIGKINRFKIKGREVIARPEDISLASIEDEETFVGTLHSWDYLGAFYRLRIEKKEYMIEVDVPRGEKLNLEEGNQMFFKVNKELSRGGAWAS